MHISADILSARTELVNAGTLAPMEKRTERERTAFGQRMREARRRADLTQVQVCKYLRIAQSTLSGLEDSALSSGRTVEFAKLYGCDATWLATGEGSPARAGEDLPEATPRHPVDINEAFQLVADFLTHTNDMTRDAIAPLLAKLAASPDNAPRIVLMINALIAAGERRFHDVPVARDRRDQTRPHLRSVGGAGIR